MGYVCGRVAGDAAGVLLYIDTHPVVSLPPPLLSGTGLRIGAYGGYIYPYWNVSRFMVDRVCVSSTGSTATICCCTLHTGVYHRMVVLRL